MGKVVIIATSIIVSIISFSIYQYSVVMEKQRIDLERKAAISSIQEELKRMSSKRLGSCIIERSNRGGLKITYIKTKNQHRAMKYTEVE